jgi:uncharacterized protein YndB with AHSA1/START domain
MQATHTLQVTTPSDREIVMTRSFNAPRALVFDAWTKPELLKGWFGPRAWQLVDCEIDLRVGGQWHYMMEGPEGATMNMRGEYRELNAPESLVSTESFDEFPAPPSLDTMVLTEKDGLTTVTVTTLYDSKETRDGMIQSGMEAGAAESFERLDELLAAR